ncbi:ABC transporter permease [Blastopirellula marina]|uniref:ABC transporter permease n=1 Tax=Blastopirellula marina TaxID=124 RepID=A0A2S8G5L0_9BACT|nr:MULTISPECIES: ABC transporter permease subunit [Pirellulaceae]PQO39444.1 ABC transporter permease [Blastopirellula marina]RCS55753.1 ABC transporter permease [Bremerella cremea]
MYLLENPVLQRELLVNLRTARAFLLLLAYQMLLAAIVYFAWPQVERLDLSADQEAARRLFDLFFLGQFVLASLMAPSFASGTLTGEKERKTYEMLLASPLKPGAIVVGKLLASLAHLALLIFTSLPIVMLCLPLGGVSLYELLAAYAILMVAVATFGMISVACSSFFARTSSSLVVSYLLILPIALAGAFVWQMLGQNGGLRLIVLLITVPAAAAATILLLSLYTARTLLYPHDVGSEGKDVVDLEKEAREAVGLVIQRDQFPDRLFAPPKRTQLLDDHKNPVYDKEIHSEIFAQGTLMLRLVIQISMFLAIPLMAVCLYFKPQYAPFYMAYVILFNILVGPVFSAGSITSERERETLDLLLTTEISPWMILSGKLVAGFRVSSVLTGFLLWPLLLACVMVPYYWTNWTSVLAYLSVILITCVTTSMLALFCSVLFRKTSHSLMCTYLVIIALFCGTIAFDYFTQLAFTPAAETAVVDYTSSSNTEPEPPPITAVAEVSRQLTLISPFSALWDVPLKVDLDGATDNPGDWFRFSTFMGLTIGMNAIMFGVMVWLFRTRWRVSY